MSAILRSLFSKPNETDWLCSWLRMCLCLAASNFLFPSSLYANQSRTLQVTEEAYDSPVRELEIQGLRLFDGLGSPSFKRALEHWPNDPFTSQSCRAALNRRFNGQQNLRTIHYKKFIRDFVNYPLMSFVLWTRIGKTYVIKISSIYYHWSTPVRDRSCQVESEERANERALNLHRSFGEDIYWLTWVSSAYESLSSYRTQIEAFWTALSDMNSVFGENFDTAEAEAIRILYDGSKYEVKVNSSNRALIYFVENFLKPHMSLSWAQSPLELYNFSETLSLSEYVERFSGQAEYIEHCAEELLSWSQLVDEVVKNDYRYDISENPVTKICQ